MLRRFAFAALALAALVGAAGAADIGPRRAFLTVAAPSWVLGAPSNAASLDFDFANGRYWQAPPSYGRDPSSLLTVSRASTEYQANASGLLIPFPSNAAAITNFGLGVWQAATNVALWSRDLTNAVWTASNVTVAKTATGADGIASGASLLTATAANGTVEQSFTIASAAQCVSAYVKRVTGSGEIDITLNGGTSWTNIASLLTTTGYVRVPTAGLSATLANPKIGFRIVTNGDAIAVDFVQLETGTFPTPPIPTTNAAVTRAADAVSLKYSFGAGYTLFGKGVPYAPVSFSGTQVIFEASDGTANNRLLLYRSATTAAPGVNNVSGGTATAIGLAATWGQLSNAALVGATAVGSQRANFGGTAGGSGTGALPIGLNKLTLGSRYDAGLSYWNGIIREVAVFNIRVPDAVVKALGATP